MRKFDTKVQYLKYKVLREVARQAWNDTLLDNVMSIPRELAPRNAETIYCCVYKERAILSERVRMAMGGNKQNPMSSRSLISPAMSVPWAAMRSPIPAAAA